jgi:hypothetical protein
MLKKSEADAILAAMRDERTSFEPACELVGVGVNRAHNHRRLGRFKGHEAGRTFDREVSKLEAEVVVAAERTLFEFASGTRSGGGTRAEARAHNVELNAAKTVLEHLYPERYGKRASDALNRARYQASLEVLQVLENKLSPSAYNEVLNALAHPGDDPLVLEVGTE